MPNCGCFHKLELEPTTPNDYRLSVSTEGHVDIQGVLNSTNLVNSVSRGSGLFRSTFQISGVTDSTTLTNFCNQLKSTIFVDLTPSLDFCHALGPYTVFNDEGSEHSDIGELVNQAKYWRNPEAIGELTNRLHTFIGNHPGFNKVTAVASPPGSNSGRPNLPRLWAEEFAAEKGWEIISATKIRTTSPQKEIGDDDTENDAKVRIANSMQVSPVQPGAVILILDDTIRSGGTLIELGNVLRQAGAAAIYGLAAAKDAKFTNGGIDLQKESWL